MIGAAAHARVAPGKKIGVLENLGLAVGRDEIGEDRDKGVCQDQQDAERRRHRHRAEQFLCRPCADMPSQLLEQVAGDAEADNAMNRPFEEGGSRPEIERNPLVKGHHQQAVSERAGGGHVAKPRHAAGVSDLAAAEIQRQRAGDDQCGPVSEGQARHHLVTTLRFTLAAGGAGSTGSTSRRREGSARYRPPQRRGSMPGPRECRGFSLNRRTAGRRPDRRTPPRQRPRR